MLHLYPYSYPNSLDLRYRYPCPGGSISGYFKAQSKLDTMEVMDAEVPARTPLTSIAHVDDVVQKKGSDDLRVVHNFIPVNKYTIKPQYPGHRIDEVIDTVIKPKYKAFFCTDAANGYWAVPIKEGDQYKTGFVTPHGQYIYLRMGQGLKGACATYSQFEDLTFGPLPKTDEVAAMPVILRTSTEQNHAYAILYRRVYG